MLYRCTMVFLALGLVLTSAAPGHAGQPPAKPPRPAMGHLDGEDIGRLDGLERMSFFVPDPDGEHARFLLRTGPYHAFLTPDGVTLALRDASAAAPRFQAVRFSYHQGEAASLEASGPMSGFTHRLVGNDASRWQRDLPHLSRIVARSIWPGIDFHYYESGGALEYDVTLAPGTAVETVAINVEGADALSIDEAGRLHIASPAGDLVQELPSIHQVRCGEKIPVEGRFVLQGPSRFGFEVAGADPFLPLVIDPTFLFATYLGGSSADEVHGVATDSAGNVYATGSTVSVDFPPNPGSLTGYYEVFVSKLDPTGSSLLFTAFVGGTGDYSIQERGAAIAVGPDGSSYVVGRTEASDFPTVNAFQPTFGGQVDAFLFRLDAGGSNLVFSTFLGGSDFEMDLDSDFLLRHPGSLAVNAQGKVWVTGATRSSDFPLLQPLDATFNGFFDVFVAGFEPNGTAVFSTFLGGNGGDVGQSIRLAQNGDLVLAGDTQSSDFATTPGAYDTTSGGPGFVARMTPDGQNLVWSSFFPGAPRAIDLDPSDNVYATGSTSDSCLPTTFGVYMPNHGGSSGGHPEQLFLGKLVAGGSEMVYLTYFGENDSNEAGSSILVNSFGEALVVGDSSSHVIGVVTYGLMVKFNADASDVAWQMLLPNSTEVLSVVAGPGGDAVAGGVTSAYNLPVTPGAFQPTYGGNYDGFLLRLDDTASSLVSVEAETPKAQQSGVIEGVVTLDGSAPAGGALVSLSSSDPAVASVPSAIAVPAGAASAPFPITTGPVSTETPVTLTASWNGSSIDGTFTVWKGPFFRIEALSSPAGLGTFASGINQDGDVVGGTSSRVLRWRNGILEDLGDGAGEDINDLEQLAVSRTELWRYTDSIGFELLGTLPGGSLGEAKGINNLGQVVGWSDGAGVWQHAVRYTDGIGLEDLGTLGGSYSTGVAINGSSVTVGESLIAGNIAWHAFRHTDAAGLEDLGALSANHDSSAYAVNELGEITGASYYFSIGSAFRWSPGAGMVDLGKPPGAVFASGLGINNCGTVIGEFRDSANRSHPFWYTERLGMQDLRELLDPEDLHAFGLNSVEDVNSAERIVGYGTNRFAGCGEGALLLTPRRAFSNTYGPGHAGTLGVPSLTVATDPVLCQTLDLAVTNSSGQTAAGALLLGLEDQVETLPSGATLLVNPQYILHIQVPPGGATISVNVPCNPSLYGVSLFLQAIQLDPGATGGKAFTPGLRLLLGDP